MKRFSSVGEWSKTYSAECSADRLRVRIRVGLGTLLLGNFVLQHAVKFLEAFDGWLEERRSWELELALGDGGVAGLDR